MYMKKYEEELKEIIISCSECVTYEEINEETDLVEDFGFSSINIIELVVRIEEKFDIEIDDIFLTEEKLTKYKNLLEIISRKKGEDNNAH